MSLPGLEWVDCDTCKGSGLTPCGACGGTGKVGPLAADCGPCDGTGRLKFACHVCNGAKRVQKTTDGGSDVVG
jgi:hypothetical protein